MANRIRIDLTELAVGDALKFSVTCDDDLTGMSLRCTVKRYQDDTDANALAVVTDGDGIELDGDDPSIAVVEFLSSVTAEWPAGVELYWDLQAEPNASEAYTPAYGLIPTRARITLTRGGGLFGNPLDIFGADDLAFWLRVEDWTAASWPDVTGNLTVTQGEGGRQFTASAGINGLPTALADDVDDFMTGALVVPIAAGALPALVCLMRYTATAVATPKVAVAVGDSGIATTGSAVYMLLRLGPSSSGGRFETIVSIQNVSPFSALLTRGDVADTDVHVFEHHVGESNPETLSYIDDEAMNASQVTVGTGVGPTELAMTDVRIGTYATLASAGVHYRDIVCVRRRMTAPELYALRSYLAERQQ